MKKARRKIFVLLGLAWSFGAFTIVPVQAQSNNTANTSQILLSPAGNNGSAAQQNPLQTFQQQNFERQSTYSAGVPDQPNPLQSTLLPSHSSIIRPNTTPFGSLNAFPDQNRQQQLPNQLSVPNPVMPQQVSRSILQPPSVMPTQFKSTALQQLQPQLISPSMQQHF